MIEIALPRSEDFPETALDPNAMITRMLARLSEPAHCTSAIQDAFRALYLPVLTKATNDPRMLAALQPAIQRKQLQQGHQHGQLLTNIDEKLDNLTTLPRDTLELLANRFEIPKAHALEGPQLIHELTLKAQEYRALKSEIDAIKEDNNSLSNMKSAAIDAIDRLDFDEVENLLSMIHSTELEVAAETAKLRAHNALMRGRGDLAFALLTSAADSFGAQHDTAPTRKRLEFDDILYAHGLRFGGQGLALAAQMNRDALRGLARDSDPDLWAATQNNLAIALRNQGTRTGGEGGNALLSDAVTAYHAALTVCTQNQHPVQWAGTQNNLASLYFEWAQQDGHKTPTETLRHALDHVDAALTEYHPDHQFYYHEKATRLRDHIRTALAEIAP